MTMRHHRSASAGLDVLHVRVRLVMTETGLARAAWRGRLATPYARRRKRWHRFPTSPSLGPRSAVSRRVTRRCSRFAVTAEDAADRATHHGVEAPPTLIRATHGAGPPICAVNPLAGERQSGRR